LCFPCHSHAFLLPKKKEIEMMKKKEEAKKKKSKMEKEIKERNR